MMLADELVQFLEVAAVGSVSAAATRQHLSQPTVSRRIAKLESDLGVKLFRRTVSGMGLTPAGEVLQTMARDIITRTVRAGEVMAALDGGNQMFTLVCPETTANHFVATFIASGSPIREIVTARPSDVYPTLLQGLDLAVNTAAPPAELSSVELVSCPIMVQFRETGQRRSGHDPIELADLLAMGGPILAPGYGSAIERAFLSTASELGAHPTEFSTTSNATIAQAHAAAGNGVAVVIEDPRFGLDWATLTNGGVPMSVQLYAAWAPDHYAEREIRAVAHDLGRWMTDMVATRTLE
ncbi:LysR family transcriptional regulator [Rhodococcus sp. ACT016]|uniref:LysR family transcriptional regulator n=1 Tax=Rhodococcus sp. ACT016 TaxID=3134808 RepID=UPI003D2B32DA